MLFLLIFTGVVVGVPITVYLSAKMGAFGWFRGRDEYLKFHQHQKESLDGKEKCG